MPEGKKMEKVFRVFKSFEEADEADKEYYLSLSPEERMRILFELHSQWPWFNDAEASKGFQRVYRIVEFPRR